MVRAEVISQLAGVAARINDEIESTGRMRLNPEAKRDRTERLNKSLVAIRAAIRMISVTT